MANEVAGVIASLKAISQNIVSAAFQWNSEDITWNGEALVWNGAAAEYEVQVFWRNDNNIIPEPPNPFVFFECEVERGRIIGYGGGRRNNRYRYDGEVLGWLAVERGRGLEFGLAMAEPIAALFRSYRDDNVSIYGVNVRPITGITDAAPNAMQDVSGNYDWYLIEIDLSFDQVG